MSLSERLVEHEGHWLMGRVAPRELLRAIGRYLHRVAPKREDELIAAIKARADELIEADKDMVVDPPAKGMLALCAVVLAAFETLRPEFDGDERRTILYLQHAFGTVLRRTFDLAFDVLTSRDDPLDALDKALRTERPFYGSYFDIDFDRPEPGTFEMKVGCCFFHDFFARHDAPLVTTVLCAWDANWMRAIDPAVSGLRAERTSLISLGDDACRFRVLETDDPVAEYADVLNQRFIDREDSA